MKTYANASSEAIELTYTAGDVQKYHVISPGEAFTFDDTQDNGQDIEQALIAAGATEVEQE